MYIFPPRGRKKVQKRGKGFAIPPFPLPPAPHSLPLVTVARSDKT